VLVSSIPEFSYQSQHSNFIPYKEIPSVVEDVALPLFPKLDCGHCGNQTCNEMVQAVIAGEQKVEECIILGEKEPSVSLTINSKDIPLNPFVQKILKNTLMGIVSTLKSDQLIETVELKVNLSKQKNRKEKDTDE
jgi:uncharacterized Fe-S cluster-containing protein